LSEPIRFGICVDQTQPWPLVKERWQLYESLGFDSVWDCDHLIYVSHPDQPYFESWTLLAALAACTSRIRIGVLVTCNTFRHPAVLAKAAITVDHVSNGRLELGLGAGWYRPEHLMFGIPFPRARILVNRFQEAVEILDRLLTEDTSSYDGKYYRLRSATSRPGPIQRPRPPLMLAGKGQRMLKIVARHADAWNAVGTPEEMRRRNALIDEECSRIGRDPATIRRSLYHWIARSSHDPWDSTNAFEELIGPYREVGVNEFIIDQPVDTKLSTLERIAVDVIPGLRASSNDRAGRQQFNPHGTAAPSDFPQPTNAVTSVSEM
jgi:F420-dependent oxidoreductase-like protein